MEDDNVTSLAYRSACPQAMDGNGQNAAGAIAVPLMTSAGCTGVLAVELREPKATPDLTALATILGAQFAALIGPADQATQAAEA
jgi:GAF domain-containing protein